MWCDGRGLDGGAPVRAGTNPPTPPMVSFYFNGHVNSTSVCRGGEVPPRTADCLPLDSLGLCYHLSSVEAYVIILIIGVVNLVVKELLTLVRVINHGYLR